MGIQNIEAIDDDIETQNVESAVVLWNVTFDGNMLSCPSQTFSYMHDVSKVFTHAMSRWTFVHLRYR